MIDDRSCRGSTPRPAETTADQRRFLEGCPIDFGPIDGDRHQRPVRLSKACGSVDLEAREDRRTDRSWDGMDRASTKPGWRIWRYGTIALQYCDHLSCDGGNPFGRQTERGSFLRNPSSRGPLCCRTRKLGWASKTLRKRQNLCRPDFDQLCSSRLVDWSQIPPLPLKPHLCRSLGTDSRKCPSSVTPFLHWWRWGKPSCTFRLHGIRWFDGCGKPALEGLCGCCERCNLPAGILGSGPANELCLDELGFHEEMRFGGSARSCSFHRPFGFGGW